MLKDKWHFQKEKKYTLLGIDMTVREREREYIMDKLYREKLDTPPTWRGGSACSVSRAH